jgi:hypothetical protein
VVEFLGGLVKKSFAVGFGNPGQVNSVGLSNEGVVGKCCQVVKRLEVKIGPASATTIPFFISF